MTELEQAALNRSASELTAIAGYAGGNTSSAACGATLCYENENATCEDVLYTARDGYYENENATCESARSTMRTTARARPVRQGGGEDLVRVCVSWLRRALLTRRAALRSRSLLRRCEYGSVGAAEVARRRLRLTRGGYLFP